MTDKNKDELLKYFVYVLIDPRNYEIFYVGKGQGFRNFDHKSGEEKQKGIKTIFSGTSGSCRAFNEISPRRVITFIVLPGSILFFLRSF